MKQVKSPPEKKRLSWIWFLCLSGFTWIPFTILCLWQRLDEYYPHTNNTSVLAYSLVLAVVTLVIHLILKQINQQKITQSIISALCLVGLAGQIYSYKSSPWLIWYFDADKSSYNFLFAATLIFFMVLLIKAILSGKGMEGLNKLLNIFLMFIGLVTIIGTIFLSS